MSCLMKVSKPQIQKSQAQTEKVKPKQKLAHQTNYWKSKYQKDRQ